MRTTDVQHHPMFHVEHWSPRPSWLTSMYSMLPSLLLFEPAFGRPTQKLVFCRGSIWLRHSTMLAPNNSTAELAWTRGIFWGTNRPAPHNLKSWSRKPAEPTATRAPQRRPMFHVEHPRHRFCSWPAAMFHVKYPKQPASIPPQHLTFRGRATTIRSASTSSV